MKWSSFLEPSPKKVMDEIVHLFVVLGKKWGSTSNEDPSTTVVKLAILIGPYLKAGPFHLSKWSSFFVLNSQHKNVKPDDWNAKAFELCLDMRTVNPRYPHIRQFPFLSNQSNHGFLSNFFSVNNFRKTNQILRTTDSEEANILRPLMSGNFSILEPAKI